MNEYYYELKITPNKYYELYLDLIMSLTEDALEELDETIIIRSEDELDEVEAGVVYFTQELQNSLDKEISCTTTLEKIENENWIQKYKDSIEPVVCGKFYIHPSWYEPKEDKLNILIDPALAFGSGHHETTSSCLDAISTYVENGNSLIDVGAGSGILSIAASKLGAVCDICDTDPQATENAVINFVSNGVTPKNVWTGSAVLSKEKYDFVVANIVADVLIMINKDLKKVLKDDGILILSGILENYEDKVLKKFEEFEILERIAKNEWRTFVLRRKN
ncbi:MAG: 50S ribosomal protein L11 methyltransferase [Arcobacteraceae bacterium]